MLNSLHKSETSDHCFNKNEFTGLHKFEGADRESRPGGAEAVSRRESGQVDLHEEDERVLDLALPTDDHDQVRYFCCDKTWIKLSVKG